MVSAAAYGARVGRSGRCSGGSCLIAALTLILVGCKPTSVAAPKASEAAPTPGGRRHLTQGPASVELGPKDEPRLRPKPKPVASHPEALEAVTHGNPEGAAEFLGPYVDKHPKDAESRLALARALISTGSYERAHTVLSPKGALAADSQIIAARALVLRLQGKLEQATRELDTAVQRDPSAIALRGDLLELLIATGHGGEPRAKTLMESLYDDWDAGRAKEPHQVLAVAKATLARGSTNAFDDANWVLGQAEQAAPVAKGSWVGDRIVLLRGAMFVEKYRPDEAAETLGLLLARNPWDADALAGMAHAHYSALQFAAATRIAAEALQVNPHHPDAHAVLAKVALIEGRRTQAKHHAVDKTLAVNPSHAGGLATAAAAELMRADEAGFARWRDRALEHNPKHGRFFAELADLLGFLHLYGPLADALEDANRRLPEDPYVQSALGLNLLRLGKEEPAIAALKRAWKRDEYNERTANVLALYDERIKQHYVDVQRGNLSLRMPKDDHELVAPGLVAAIERARTALDRHYRTKAGALRLEFYENPKDFSVRTTGVTSLGAAAVCFGNVITFTGPYHGTHNIDQVIWHELGHVYAIERSGGRVPRWFTEGLSEWESELADPAWARESAALLSAARRHGRLRGLEELELAFIRAESPQMMEVAYSTSAYAVRYLGETYGRPQLIAMLDAWGTGKTSEEVFAKVLGKSLADVAREFDVAFNRELDQRVAGWHPQATKNAKPEKREELFAKAQEQLSAKQIDEASKTLEALITAGGDGYHPRMLLAGILSDGPKPKSAIRHIERARAFHSEAADPLILLAHIARRAGDTAGEKRYLLQTLAIDAQAFGPAARLLMLALVTNDAKARKIALARTQAIAPLHPATLAARALGTKAAEHRRALLERSFPALKGGEGAGETYVIAALAAQAVGEDEIARIFVTHARKDRELPKEALDVLDRIAKGG